MNTLFWNAPESIRYGIADIQHGSEAIYSSRAQAPSVTPQRKLQRTIITTFGSDFATVSTEFINDNDKLLLCRQMQTLVKVGSTSDL